MRRALLDAVLDIPSSPTATNFYLDSSDQWAVFASTAANRQRALTMHLDRVHRGDVVLVGEAAGWRGARQSGVAFTSPVSVGIAGTREPTATTVHRTLAALDLDDRALLWNAFPLHPHRLGVPNSNRTPTSAELAAGQTALSLAVAGRKIVCVGAKAATSVARLLGIRIVAPVDVTSGTRAVAVRHPSFGGTTQFGTDVSEAAARWGL